MPTAPAEPVVTVWRNQIPHRCTLLYHGRGLRFIQRKERRLINLRWMHLWTVHSPVIGGETFVVQCQKGSGSWHLFEAYQRDGSPLPLGEPTEVPDA